MPSLVLRTVKRVEEGVCVKLPSGMFVAGASERAIPDFRKPAVSFGWQEAHTGAEANTRMVTKKRTAKIASTCNLRA